MSKINLLTKFDEREKETWAKLHSTEGKRQFLQQYFKYHFDDFVYLLGYRDLGKFHVEQIKALSQVRKINDDPVRRLWLWSRGFFKTSLITEAHSAWLIVNNPDIRILLSSNTISVAEDMLRNIKSHFISNADFRVFFKEFCPQPNSVGKIEFGTAQEFTIPNRKKVKKEPTMMVAGIGTNLTGLHFDYMKLDDLVTKDSVTNETQLQQSKDYYASLRHLFDKAAVPREDVVGTIYHFNDLYCATLRKSKLFVESFVPAKVGDEAIFPERLPLNKLTELVNDPSVGPYQFQTQYMLNPINPADAKFKDEWIKTYEKIPEGLAEYVCVDPASTTNKKSDYTVIERWGIDSNGNSYLLDGIRDKLTAFQRIDALFTIVSKCKNLKWVKYEVIGGRHGDLEEIERRQVAALQKAAVGGPPHRRFTVKETKSSSISKIDRIEQRLVGQYHAGKVLWPETLYYISKYDGKVHNFIAEMKLEYLQFPFTEHDDILDCQAQMFDEPWIKGKKTEEVKKTSGMTAADWDRMYAELNRYSKKYPDMSSNEIQSMISTNKLGQKLRVLQYRRG